MAHIHAIEKYTKQSAQKAGDAGTSAREAGEEGQAETKFKKKIIIFGMAALVLLLTGLGTVCYTGFFNKLEVGSDGKPTPIFYTLPESVVNLTTGDKKTTFLKAIIIFELSRQSDISQIQATMPRLQDTIDTYLRDLHPIDLIDAAGIQRLRAELLFRANKTLAPIKINGILFKEIVVQ